jgi:hypothetical protein
MMGRNGGAPDLFARVLAAMLVLAGVAFAHNPDTSYARVIITDSAIEVRLTFDVFTLQKIVELDADRDQRVTRAELQRAAPAIQHFLRANVGLEVDGQPADLGEATAPAWPKDAGDALTAADWHSVLSLITFPFRKSLTSPPHDVALAFDVFDAFGERHTVLGAFEHGGETHEVTFTQAEPDYLLDLTYARSSDSSRSEPSQSATVLRFLKLGIAHIFLGYDHICFLLALIVVSRFGELVKIVTAFTIAHSITLILAALKIVTLPTRLIESGIALTILYVAIENIVRKHPTHRWRLTFAFGLIHGFGFANVLAELGLPTSGTVRCLLSFNVGVELGQLAIVLLALPLVLLLDRSRYASQTKLAISALIALFGLAWFIERAFKLGFMPV